jgi:rod shape-determining protein MreD
MRRYPALLLPLIVLWAVASEVNHALGGWQVYVFVGALYVVHAALMQRWRHAAFVAIFGGLMCDATRPVAFGTHMLLFLLAAAAVHRARERLPREDTTSRIIVALLVNLALFLAFSFTQIHRSPAPAAIWPRLIVDLVGSQIFLVLIGPWFFALQTRALALARVPRETYA